MHSLELALKSPKRGTCKIHKELPFRERQNIDLVTQAKRTLATGLNLRSGVEAKNHRDSITVRKPGRLSKTAHHHVREIQQTRSRSLVEKSLPQRKQVRVVVVKRDSMGNPNSSKFHHTKVAFYPNPEHCAFQGAGAVPVIPGRRCTHKRNSQTLGFCQIQNPFTARNYMKLLGKLFGFPIASVSTQKP